MGRRAAICALLAAASCAEAPSFEVRWRIAPAGAQDPAAAPDLTAAHECAEVGLFQVAVETRTEDGGLLLDRRVHRCFPRSFGQPAGAVDGPELPAGVYQVRLQGIRRDGFAYEGPAEGAGAFAPGVTVIDGVTVDGPGGGLRLEFEGGDPPIVAPDPCTDGVDNDRDGYVDEADLACRLGAGGGETDEARILQIRLEVSLFGENPNMRSAESCIAVGIERFSVTTTDGRDVGEVPCAEAVTGPAYFNLVTTDPPEGVVVEGVAADGTPVTTAETHATPPSGLAVVRIDFSEADFLDPVVSPFGFVLRFAGGASDCNDPDGGTLTLPQVRIAVRGAHGEALADPVNLDDGTPLDGAAPMACPSSFLVTETVPWGGYLVEAEALSEQGEVCFATKAPVPAAPGTPIAFVVDLVRVEPPPPSCRTCVQDADCGPGGVCTDEGLCGA